MNASFVFKLVVLIWTWLKLTLVAFPFSFALISLKEGKFKYGYDFFDLDYRAAFLIAFGIGMALSVWNAFEFSNLKLNDLKQWMKSKQRHYYKYRNTSDFETAKHILQQWANDQKRWKVLQSDDTFVLKKNNYHPINDKIEIKAVDGGLEISSWPVGFTWFIDLGRNFKNTVLIGDVLRAAQL